MKIEHVYVDYLPQELKSNTLYISEYFQIALHLCFCGCGYEIATPLTKGMWELEKLDNKNVSLRPSIGNYNIPCKSHYFITDNQVVFV